MNARRHLGFPRIEVESLGFLERVALVGETLEIDGCAASRAAPLDGFRILVGAELPIKASWELGLPKSLVDRGWGGLLGADKAGFAIRARLGRGQRRLDQLVSVIPVFKGQVGCALPWVSSSSLPLPSEDFQTGIGGYFLPVAFEFLAHCVQRAGLQENAAVLDVGCGVGRMAFALAPYLAKGSHYEGFDIVSKWIDWARSEITPRFGNFRFSMVNVRNDHYNPTGSISPSELKFPHPDGSFDFALATSLFTHLREAAARRYVEQIGRVLRPGGRCLSTRFLLDDEARQLIAAKKTSHVFVHPIDGGYTSRPDAPECAIAYNQNDVHPWFKDSGLKIIETLPGLWCWRDKFVSFQDILIAEKSA